MNQGVKKSGAPKRGSDFLYADELGERLGVSGYVIRQMIERGRLPKPLRIGRNRGWPRHEIERELRIEREAV